MMANEALVLSTETPAFSNSVRMLAWLSNFAAFYVDGCLEPIFLALDSHLHIFARTKLLRCDINVFFKTFQSMQIALFYNEKIKLIRILLICINQNIPCGNHTIFEAKSQYYGVIYMSHFRDSNPGLTLYERVTLPTELKWHNSFKFYHILIMLYLLAKTKYAVYTNPALRVLRKRYVFLYIFPNEVSARK